MTGNIRLIKSRLLINILTATNEFDCISGALGDLRFQNFPGEHAPGPPKQTNAFGVRYSPPPNPKMALWSLSMPSDPTSCEVRPSIATPTLPNATSTMKCFETTAYSRKILDPTWKTSSQASSTQMCDL
jgi:hypothetical protein